MVLTHKIICGDCIEVMEEMESDSVDLIVTDPPYGINKAEWDKGIDFFNLIDRIYPQFVRILKEQCLAFIWFPKKKLYELYKLNFKFNVFIEIKNFA